MKVMKRRFAALLKNKNLFLKEVEEFANRSI